MFRGAALAIAARAVLLVILALVLSPGPALSGFSTPGFDKSVHALIVHNGDLIAGGEFTSFGDTPLSGIARWDGHQWQPLGEGVAGAQYGWQYPPYYDPQHLEPQVSALVSWGGDLVAGGAFVSAGSDTAWNVARWDGLGWHPLGDGLRGTYDVYEGLGSGWGTPYCVRSLVVIQDTLWAGGTLMGCLQFWDGQAWQMSTRRIVCPEDWEEYLRVPSVRALASIGGQLVLGGYFFAAHPPNEQVHHLAGWNGAGLEMFGGGVRTYASALDARVDAMLPWDDGLLVAGCFTHAGSVAARNVALWDGQVWRALGVGTPNPISALTVYHDDLFAGAHRWDGANWENVLQTDAAIRAATVFRDRLVVGGDFAQMGGTPAGRIGAWPDEMTPVTLQAFTATRIGPAAELSWRLADGGEAVLNVWRREGGAALVRLTVEPLTAATGAYRDEAPPAAGAEYWLEEFVLEGESIWFGPAVLGPVPAAAVTLDVAPNPFNPGATIGFTLMEPEVVRLTVHDLRGALVATLAHGPRGVGEHTLRWDGTDGRGRAVAAGTYLLQLVAGRESAVRKVCLAR